MDAAVAADQADAPASPPVLTPVTTALMNQPKSSTVTGYEFVVAPEIFAYVPSEVSERFHWYL
jgi:hypothetical protein